MFMHLDLQRVCFVFQNEAKPNKRALIELPHHLTSADQEDELLTCCLTNLSFIYWKLRASSYEK